MDEEKGIELSIDNSNTRFYKAFESLSIEKMEEVWKHSDDTICIHPGWEMFTGWTAIRESWVSIFNNTRTIEFFITNTKIKLFKNTAVVVCLENIRSVIYDENSMTGMIATNIFEKKDIKNKKNYNNEWLMIHHHGSIVVNYMPPNVSV